MFKHSCKVLKQLEKRKQEDELKQVMQQEEQLERIKVVLVSHYLPCDMLTSFHAGCILMQ